MSAEEKPGDVHRGAWFVRSATGLVRQLSALDIFVWSIIFFPWLTSWAGVFWARARESAEAY
ncbi:MAG: hypothetical protein HYU03_04710 [Thaumarchaeota archaeon]|nr:hypothetical protein [Nitrososphaerota archaeon]MBI3022740.1 hypothetical protein [Nitrososphaerota archaeon]MCS4539976.1 hypothetical protein [Nitrososphaerota archaeon]